MLDSDTSEITGEYVYAPRPGAADALRSHWGIVVASVIVLVAAAAALGLGRRPAYTATARLTVGEMFVDNAAAVPGVLEASETLASNYSRMIGATPVLDRTHRLAGITGGTVAATPIPGSTLIKVSATASSSGAAVKLANAAGNALTHYVNQGIQSGQNAQTAFSQYRHAALDYATKEESSERLDQAYAASPTDANLKARNRAAAEAQAAELRRDALGDTYQRLLQAGDSSPRLEPFSRASGVTSDRRSVLSILLVIGLAAGLAVGVALAMLRAGRRSDRPLPL